ncbi:MAG TPA: YceH family protein [Accumulibacter sp.]|nr:YceH family protein [Accumulibacter sp.]
MPNHNTADELTIVEARILAVLVEKEKTTPDVYPLTLNSLSAGCNQKSARDPVLSLSDSEIQSALENLRSRVLVIESYGASGRVLRYAQNFGKVYGLPAASVSLLSTLMLRGPQTVSELRANCERLYRFDDASSVEAYLNEMAQRPAGGLCQKLPKQAGSREHRWMHLLCGNTSFNTTAYSSGMQQESLSLNELAEKVHRLEDEMAELKQRLDDLTANRL